MKLQVGNKTTINLKNIEWYWSHQGQMSHTYNGKFGKSYDGEMRTWLMLMLDPTIQGTVVAVNWPNSVEENYRVKILEMEINLEPKCLKKVKNVSK